MNFDIEFLPVGDGEKAGDAIVISYGDPARPEVMVVDGGTQQSGEEMVEHINQYFGPETVLSHVVCTHPDSDHTSGLRPILETFQVANLWLHVPWFHAKETAGLFSDKRWTVAGLTTSIKKEYPITEELVELAVGQGAAVQAPHQGAKIGPFVVLSPPQHVYEHLVPQFRRTPDPDVDAIRARRMWLPQRQQPAGLIAKALKWIREHWESETLRSDGVTAAENETSVVLYGDFGQSAVLLTGDAGVNALSLAYHYAMENGLDLEKLALIQVPHHGSRNNVSPEILDAFIGPIQPANAPERCMAVVSAPKDDAKHPRRVVINAFLRRGAGVHSTQGGKCRYNSGMLARDDYTPAQPLEFFNEVEEYD